MPQTRREGRENPAAARRDGRAIGAKGRELLDARLPKRRHTAIGPSRLAELPLLRELAWHLAEDDAGLTPEEAFQLYERNWRHIERDKLGPREARLIDRLTRTVGKAVMLV